MKNMVKYLFKKKSKAFTLLEIMIVIVIIGVLMGATMRYGGDRIGFLNNKTVKEQFVSHYDKLYSDNMMTSYYMGDIYKNLNIHFLLGEDNFTYVYQGYNVDYSGTMYVDAGEYQIAALYLDGQDVDKLNISLVPYVLSCTIDGEDFQNAVIDILVNKSVDYCFEINADNCRINQITCSGL